MNILKSQSKCSDNKRTTALFAFLLILISQVTYSAPQPLASITLSDVLAATLSTQKNKSNNSDHTLENSATTWLASSPKLGLNYIASNHAQGTDEYEVSVNLPIKSALQTSIDANLIQLNESLNKVFLLNKKLYFSGLVRKQLWDIKIAQAQRDNTQQKLVFLERLEKQYQKLLQNKQVTRYSLLLINKELLDTKIIQLNHSENLKSLIQQYTILTGLNSLPKQINEEELTTDNTWMSNHPSIQQIDQEWFELEQTLKLSTKSSEPWNVVVNAKKLDNNIFDETQLGVGVELPISFLSNNKQSLSNEWRRERNNYELTRSAQLIALQQEFQRLIGQQQTLTKTQNILEQSKTLSKAIITETQLLIEANQIEQEQAIRRMLNAFNTKAQLNLNQLLILKNIAMLRQSAGITL